MKESGSVLLHHIKIFFVTGLEKLPVKLRGNDKPILKPQVFTESHHIGQITTCFKDFCGHGGIMFQGGIK